MACQDTKKEVTEIGSLRHSVAHEAVADRNAAALANVPKHQGIRHEAKVTGPSGSRFDFVLLLHIDPLRSPFAWMERTMANVRR